MPDSDTESRTRRGVLAAAGTGLAAMLTGCGGFASSGSEGPTTAVSLGPTETQTPTETRTETPTETRTEAPTETATPTQSPEPIATRFVERFTAQEFDAAAAVFSSPGRLLSETAVGNAKESFTDPAQVLQRYWLALTSQHGAFESITNSTVADGTVTVQLRFESDSQKLRLDVGGDGITDLQFPAEYSPPSYARPDAFRERTLNVHDGDLEGTLTLPAGANEEVPCVVFVPSSIADDRDLTVGPNKIYRDIAWGLASQGIATYRYDRRSLIGLAPEEEDIDTLYVNDAVAAASRVADVGPVRSDRIFVAGHTRSGKTVPRIAARHGDPAGIALLDTLLFDVTAYAFRAKRAIQDAEWYIERERQSRITRYERLANLDPTEIDLSATIYRRGGAFWKSLLEYDHVATMTGLSIPKFVSHVGRSDLSVRPELRRASYERWQRVLSEDTTEFAFYAETNPVFQPGTPPALRIEAQAFHDNATDALVTDLVEWVRNASPP